MKSPLTGGETTLIEKIEEHEFRKEKFMIHVRYYVCNDTNETFTTNEQDELFCNELYSQYRIKHLKKPLYLTAYKCTQYMLHTLPASQFLLYGQYSFCPMQKSIPKYSLQLK